MYSYKNMLYFLHQMCVWFGFVFVSAAMIASELASVSKTEISKVGNLTVKVFSHAVLRGKITQFNTIEITKRHETIQQPKIETAQEDLIALLRVE